MVSTKSRNKVAVPSSRTGFKRRPDHDPGNKFSSRTVFKLPRPKKDTFIENVTVSEEHQIQEILTVCIENVSRFDYFYLKPFISTKIQEWGNITSDKEILKTVKGLTLDFEQEPQVQKIKMMSGQASQKMMVEINKFVGKGVIEYTDHKK